MMAQKIQAGWAAIGRASNFRTSREACTGALMSAGVKSMRLPSRSRRAGLGGRGSHGGSASVRGACDGVVIQLIAGFLIPAASQGDSISNHAAD
jgi:hypothetical protein